MHFDFKNTIFRLKQYIPSRKVFRWLWYIIIAVIISLLILDRADKNSIAQDYYQENDIFIKNQHKYVKKSSAAKSNTPITARAHILIITESPQDPPNHNSNRNLLIMLKLLESLRFKFTIHSITNTRKSGNGLFPSLTDKNDENKGRFSLVKQGFKFF